MSPLRLTVPRPPDELWKRRLILLVVGVLALGGVGAALHGSGSTTSDAGDLVATTAPAPTEAPTTTVDPKAIQAGVANLLGHEGPTPQELASAPTSSKGGGGSSKGGGGRHGNSGGSHAHH